MHCSPQSNTKTDFLFSISLRHLFLTCFLMPVIGVISAFVAGSATHPDVLYNYNWTCGVEVLPSISRVINLPLERTIFQFLILLHTPIHLLVVMQNWVTFKCLGSSTFIRLLRVTMLISSVIEIIQFAMLSVVGERESGNLHVVLFSTFILSAYINIFSTNVLTRILQRKYPKENFGNSIRLWSLLGLTFCVPMIFLVFTLYNTVCMEHTYELFAIFEYTTVFFLLMFHFSNYFTLFGNIAVVRCRKVE